MSELTDRGKRRIYRVLSYISQADGEVHDRERELLESTRQQLGLSVEEAEALGQRWP